MSSYGVIWPQLIELIEYIPVVQNTVIRYLFGIEFYLQIKFIRGSQAYTLVSCGPFY